MGQVSIDDLAEEMYGMVLATQKAKVLTPSDLVQTMVARHRGEGVTRTSRTAPWAMAAAPRRNRAAAITGAARLMPREAAARRAR